MAGFHHGDDDLDDLQDFALDGEDEAAEGANILMVVVVSLLFLTAFGCVVWVAYNNGVAHGRNEVLTESTHSNLPEGLDGKSAAQAAAPHESEKNSDAQASDGAVAKMVAESMADSRKPAPAVPQKAAPENVPAAKPDAKPAAKPDAKPAVKPDTKPAAKPEAKPAAKPATKPAAKPVSAPAEKVQAKSAPKTAPVAAKPAPAAPADSHGEYTLQVGAFPSMAEAENAWKKFSGSFHGLLSGASHNIQKADLGSKGTWYRLRVGAYASKADASAMCDKVKASGGRCYPVH